MMPSRKYILGYNVVLSIISTIATEQFSSISLSENHCMLRNRCSECIQSPSCAWCASQDYSGNARCFNFSSSSQTNTACREEYIILPKTTLGVISNKELGTPRTETESSQGKIGRVIQVAPQRINLKLRANNPFSIIVKYKHLQQQHPLDVYYLMDGSLMHSDRESLFNLGKALVEITKNLTSDFKLGFGSFANKGSATNTAYNHTKTQHSEGSSSFIFRHHMSLDDNAHTFSSGLQNVNFSESLSAVKVQSHLDAIMQAVVCVDKIGWRERSTKILVVSVDDYFYVPTAERFGLGIKPNIGNCYLSNDGKSTKVSHRRDPSIDELKLAIQRNLIDIIIAIKNGTSEQSSTTTEGSIFVLPMGDNSNIVDLIRERFDRKASTLEMKHNASRDINVQFSSSCLDQSGNLESTNKCQNLKVGDTVKFQIDITVRKCHKDPKYNNQTVQIYPVGFTDNSDSLIISLEAICHCDCGKNVHNEKSSEYCFHRGIYTCGICECHSGAYGRQCECQAESGEHEPMACNRPGGLICSGRGNCICGRCSCHQRPNVYESIYGRYCECDNFSCMRSNGILCGGHGRCHCGYCLCEAGWAGADCGCNLSIDTCRPQLAIDGSARHNASAINLQKPALVCSGRGECHCGQCVCYNRENFHEKIYGAYCQCDNFSCLKRHRILCSGHGSCDCGYCLCEAGWTGPDCSCNLSQHFCNPLMATGADLKNVSRPMGVQRFG